MLKKELPLRFDSALEYIIGYDHHAFAFLDERVRYEDQDRAMWKLSKEPVVFANLLKNNNEITEIERRNRAFSLVFTPGNVTVIIGAKRHGKTALVFYMALKAHQQGIKVYWYGYSEEIEKQYPWMIQTFDLKKVEGGVLFVDETAVFNSARGGASKEQSDRMAQIFTCGHSDYSMVYLSQTMRIDVRILNTMDVLWFKPFFQMDFDREQAKGIFSETYEYLRPVNKDENLVIDYQTNNSWFFTNPLPSAIGGKWNDKLSKPFARLQTEKSAIRFLKMLMDAGLSQRESRVWMAQRGWDLETLIKKVADNEQKQLDDKGNPDEVSKRTKELKGLGLMMCYACGGFDLTGKGKRKGMQRLECRDCGSSGYEHKFQIDNSKFGT